MDHLHLDIVRPDQLTRGDKALWMQWVAEKADLSGPYFDVRYFETIGPAVPYAQIARIHQGDRIVAFLPVQRRGRVMQPLGAPLTDFHGLISAPGTVVDLSTVLNLLGGRRLEFDGWVNRDLDLTVRHERQRLYADLSGGFDAYYRNRYEAHRKFYRNVERCRRNLAKDVSDLTFAWEAAKPDVIDWVLAHKRHQYNRTGLHDVFACGWTQHMLTALSGRTGDFGLMAGVYRQDETIIAAEIALRSGPNLHLWFPAYDPDYSRYGPGIGLSLDIMKAAATDGVTRVDFGFGDETYKSTMTTHAELCLQGHVALRPATSTRPHPLVQGLKTRLAIIRACETRLSGQVKAALQLGRRAMMRARVATVAFASLVGLIGGSLIVAEVM